MITCVAIDDEPIALSIIQEYCRRYGDIELHCFTSPVEGMEYVGKLHPDIIFLDIEMNSHNGVDLARQLPKDICRIFTTAYSQYALDGFNADAIDFLQKPIFYPRFERAIEKAKRWLSNHNDYKVPFTESITLKVEHKNVIVNLSDIIFVEAMDNYVKIFRRDLPMVLSQITMKEMEYLLPHDKFMRVHRSFIISIKDIERYSTRQIHLCRSDRTIPLGRKYAPIFNNLLQLLNNR